MRIIRSIEDPSVIRGPSFLCSKTVKHNLVIQPS